MSSTTYSRRNKKQRGESSRPPAPPAEPQYSTKFSSKHNAQWYEDRKNNEFVVEKSMDLGLAREIGILQAFQKLSWGAMLDMYGPYYPELVKEFYANLDIDRPHRRLGCTIEVRGTQFTFDEATIARFTDLENVGDKFSMHQNRNAYDQNWCLDAAASRMQLTYTSRPHGQRDSRAVLYTSELSALHKLAVHFFYHNILPAKSGTNEVRSSDVYFLDYMTRQDAQKILNLPAIICNNVRFIAADKKTTRAYFYPIFLSKLLVAIGVPLAENEPIVLPRPGDSLTIRNLKRLKIERNTQGHFVNVEIAERDPPPQVPESAPNAQSSHGSDTTVLAAIESLRSEMSNMHVSILDAIEMEANRRRRWEAAADRRMDLMEEDIAYRRRHQPEP